MDTLTPTATTHGVDTYLPEPKKTRTGIALCLSGGGFRAALFHAGALRRLNELGILSSISTISSVSGGSITSAHLADRIPTWPAAGQVLPNWKEQIAAPFYSFTGKNLRTGPLLKRLLPWNWFKPSTAVEALAQSYESRLIRLKLNELPAQPRFIFCATDMAFGVNWVFERDYVGDYQAGYARPAPNWPVARAVAASSCFPPIFDPLPTDLKPGQLTGGKGLSAQAQKKVDFASGLRLTDGGVYDNMGLEPVWKTHKVVLVSDGGAVFETGWDKGLLWRLSRYTSIIGRQASSLRKRWLISGFLTGEMEGTYWGIGSATTHYGPKAPSGYSQSLVEDIISKVRTDMDAFSAAERAVLENHGYLLAEAAIQQHAPHLISAATQPLALPHPEWMDERKVRRAMKDSHLRKLPLGRF